MDVGIQPGFVASVRVMHRALGVVKEIAMVAAAVAAKYVDDAVRVIDDHLGILEST